jgi:LacI family transcriptional regulator
VLNSYAVARAAGVSRSVVSCVIRGIADRHRIAKATQDRVWEAVRRLGYTPDQSVRNMFLGKSAGLLRMAAARMETPAFLATLAPILAQKGYRLVAVADDGGGGAEPMPTPAPTPAPAAEPEPTPDPTATQETTPPSKRS